MGLLMIELMTLKEVVAQLKLSRSTIYRLIAARDFDEKIKAGQKDAAQAPKSIRALLGSGFPKAYSITGRLRRYNKEEIDAWVKNKHR